MLITEFHKYMEIGGASERHQNNGLKMVIAFALSIGKDVTLYDIKSNEPDKVQSPYVYTLDVKLEDFVEKVLLKQGYTSTQTRQKLEGVSHALNEIDIVAHKIDRLTAIECKNYSEARTVGIKEIRDFQSKLQDLPQIHDAIFVTNARFSSEAEIYSAHHNISLWDGDKLIVEYII
jgi:Holliday junction resolvase-like predicted endonuclease